MADEKEEATDNAGKPKKRKDGRRAALYYLKPSIIRQIRAAARAKDQKAWQFVENAVIKALADEAE